MKSHQRQDRKKKIQKGLGFFVGWISLCRQNQIMRHESMHVGMKVQHPDYGVGTVKSVSEHLADIRFDSGLRTLAPEQCDLKPAEAQADLSGMTVPLSALISETVAAMVQQLGLERDDSEVEQLAARWQKGTLVLRPADQTLQSKETP